MPSTFRFGQLAFVEHLIGSLVADAEPEESHGYGGACAYAVRKNVIAQRASRSQRVVWLDDLAYAPMVPDRLG
jgi:hypothetical protein